MDGPAIRQLFAGHNLRWTKQREEVYAALAASKAHPTAEELFNLVHPAPTGPGAEGGMSLATVYNTLDALVRCGLARRLNVMADGETDSGPDAPAGGGGCRYDADVFDHAHVIAPDGQIRDLPEDLSRKVLEAIPRDLIEQIERRLGVPIGRTSIEFVQAPARRDVQA